MSRASLIKLWHNPMMRATALHLALLGSGFLIAKLVASTLGLSVSLLGILLGYAVVNILLTGWLLKRRAVVAEPEADETADALAEFADDPLGIVIGDAKERLAKARRKVGRQAAMYAPLDRLVRLTRKMERRLALEPELRAGFSRALSQELPLIATTAEQYVVLAGQELSSAENARLIIAEGVLREAADRLEALSNSDGKVDAPVIGLIRMDTHSEVLAERLSANTEDAAHRATAARVSHALRRAAKSVDGEFGAMLRERAIAFDAMPVGEGSLVVNATEIVRAAEAVVAEPAAEREAALRRLL